MTSMEVFSKGGIFLAMILVVLSVLSWTWLGIAMKPLVEDMTDSAEKRLSTTAEVQKIPVNAKPGSAFVARVGTTRSI